ncbi:MAG: hypothetical protein M0Q24_11060 [Sulfurimonas sp.]|uniref:hypothetical protein n=1 Tax=Sulfurimonas sp. TaxID=2022749 RepID=UPI0025F3A1F1|nr:hypothetical protein [Sulfurimonas sp.]MCK9492613.1 hypothetical protein [Sulfurimonas sp.]
MKDLHIIVCGIHITLGLFFVTAMIKLLYDRVTLLPSIPSLKPSAPDHIQRRHKGYLKRRRIVLYHWWKLLIIDLLNACANITFAYLQWTWSLKK